MRTILFTVILWLIVFQSIGQKDSIQLKLTNDVKLLKEELQSVKQGQLNYQIEKDLLKETYSNNFDRINIVITIVLGIIAILGFIGIRDLSSLKKNYISELDNLKKLKTDFENKLTEFESSKKLIESELLKINKLNDEQNSKIKILELKEKINSFIKQEEYSMAYEYIVIALEQQPDDVNLLFSRALVQTRLTQYREVIQTYQRILSLSEKNQTAIANLAEVYLFNNQNEKFDELIVSYPEAFSDKKYDELMKFFNVIKYYNSNQKEKMLEVIFQQIEGKEEKVGELKWIFKDALYFASKQERSENNLILLAYIFYLDNKYTATELKEKLNKFLP
jgi:hypothetical protein